MAVLVKDTRFYTTFFRLTGTIALQNLIVFSVNLADNIMLGAYGETSLDRKSTRLNSSHPNPSRMPSSA